MDRALCMTFLLYLKIPHVAVSACVDNICFPSLLTDTEMTEQVGDRATLVLASVAKRVKRSHSKWATSVIQRLENRLGIHGIYAVTCYICYIYLWQIKEINKKSKQC